MSDYHYPGAELELFSQARRWKAYWASQVSPFVQGDVLDAGAGQGNNLEILLSPHCRSWTALEPDGNLLGNISRLGAVARDPRLKPVVGTTELLLASASPPDFDTILYIDVLEHIEDDMGEFRRAAQLLRPGGSLVVLSPAHPFLYSPFDAAIGHFRRYNRGSLGRLSAPGLARERMFFMDAAGFLLSAANRALLRQSMPGKGQIRFWDQWVIPVSRVIDPLVGRSFGRSIVGIWKRSA